MHNVNVAALVAEIRSLARESRRLKDILRETWPEPVPDVIIAAQRAWVISRRRSTRLLILRAWLRGRFHLQKPLREGAYPGMKWDRERYHCLVAEQVSQEFVRETPSLLGVEAAS